MFRTTRPLIFGILLAGLMAVQFAWAEEPGPNPNLADAAVVSLTGLLYTSAEQIKLNNLKAGSEFERNRQELKKLKKRQNVIWKRIPQARSQFARQFDATPHRSAAREIQLLKREFVDNSVKIDKLEKQLKKPESAAYLNKKAVRLATRGLGIVTTGLGLGMVGITAKDIIEVHDARAKISLPENEDSINANEKVAKGS